MTGSSIFMNILVMGAGAVGSVFGGFLAKAGHRVFLIGRKGHMKAIRERGLEITGIWGEHLVRELEVSTGTADIPPEHFDLVLITTKSYDTREATKQILPLLADNTLVISLQNGLGNIETISAIVGAYRAVGGMLIFGVELIEEGRVKVTVCADNVRLGSPDGMVDSNRVVRIAKAFSEAGIPTETTNEIEKFIWGKVVYNSCLNALSALLEVSYGELSEHSETREIITAIIEEIFSVARKKGIVLAWNSPAEYQQHLFGRLIPDTYAHHASMLYDVKRGRRTEIDSLNGAIARLGEELGLQTPVNRTLTQLIKARERISHGNSR